MRKAAGLLRVTTLFVSIAMMTLLSTPAYADPNAPGNLPSSSGPADPMPLVLLGLGFMSIGGVLLRRGRTGGVPTG